MVLHQPVKNNVFNVRATYQREAEKAVAHLNSMGITRIGIFYADDSFGADGVAGAQKGLAAAKLQPSVLEKFSRSKPDFGPLAPKVVETNTQAVIMVASGQAVVDGTKALRLAGSAAQVVTLSNNASSGLIKSLGDNARGVIVTQVFPYERPSLTASSKKPRSGPRPRVRGHQPGHARSLGGRRCWSKDCAGPASNRRGKKSRPRWKAYANSTSAAWK